MEQATDQHFQKDGHFQQWVTEMPFSELVSWAVNSVGTLLDSFLLGWSANFVTCTLIMFLLVSVSLS